MYSIEVRHEGLHKYRMIKGNDKYVVEQKAFLQKKQWDEMWKRKLEIEKKQRERENANMEKAQKKAMAEQQTKDAVNQLELIDKTLLFTLDIDDKIDWDSLKDHSKFKVPKPTCPQKPSYPTKPEKRFFEPSFGILDKIFSSNKQKKIDAANKSFEDALINHKKVIEEMTAKYDKDLSAYEEKVEKWNEKKKVLK